MLSKCYIQKIILCNVERFDIAEIRLAIGRFEVPRNTIGITFFLVHIQNIMVR